MARKKKTRRTITALMAVSLIGGVQARPALARSAESADDRALSRSLSLWLDRRFADPWQPALRSLSRLVDPGKASPIAQDRGVRKYDIAGGPLEAVLTAYQAASGVAISVPADLIRGVQSAGVSGSFTAQQALERVLAGTALTFRFTAPFAAVVEIRLTESVDVTGTTRLESPKYTAPLRDTPQTITVIPKQLMEAQSATTLREVLRNVPGITIQAGEGGTPAGDQMAIRGFSARTDIFIDGVRDFGGYSRDAFNLEQVEVTKGPASATTGRGSTGGSVNMVSKAPTLQASRSLSASGGTSAYKRGALDVNQPVNGLAGGSVRLNVMWQDSDTPGRDVVESRRWGVAPSISVGLKTATQLTASYFRLQQDGIPDYGLPWVPATNVPLAAYANQAPPIDFSNFYGMRQRDYEQTATDLGTVVASHAFGGAVTLRNQVRYGRTNRDSMITAPRFVSNTSTDIRRTDWKSRDQTDEIAANQLDATARFRTAGVAHSLVTGIELSHEIDENRTRVETGPAAPDTDLFRPNPDDTYVGGLALNGALTRGTARSLAAYAFDTIALGSRWDLTGGARWDSFDIDYDSVAATGVVSRFERTDRMVSWRGGAVFKPRPNGSVYAGAGTSFNPSAEGLSLSAATVNLAPEQTRNYEVGTKWDLPRRRLSINAAIFHTEKTNARTPGINPGDPPTVLDGRQRVRGVEAGAAGRLTSRWELYGGYAFMSSAIRASNTAAELENDLTLTPRQTFNLWTTFRLPWDTTVGGGAQFMDTVFRNTLNTTGVPSYWVFSAMGARDIGPHLTVRVNANNLSGAQYVDRVGGGHFIPGPGRSASVTTGFRF
ncbi:MAG: TonB-dependent siderophore receptor [Acidobacteriota bacterium]